MKTLPFKSTIFRDSVLLSPPSPNTIGTDSNHTHDPVPSLTSHYQHHVPNKNIWDEKSPSPHCPVRNTVVDIRKPVPSHMVPVPTKTKNNMNIAPNSLDDEAQNINKHVTSFDAIVDKALGKLNKYNKKYLLLVNLSKTISLHGNQILIIFYYRY